MALREGIYPYAALCRVRWLLYIRSRAGRDGVRMKHSKYATDEERQEAIRERRRKWDRENKDKKHEIYRRRRERLGLLGNAVATYTVVKDPEPETALETWLRLCSVEVNRMSWLGTFTTGTVLAASSGELYKVIGDVDTKQRLEAI